MSPLGKFSNTAVDIAYAFRDIQRDLDGLKAMLASKEIVDNLTERGVPPDTLSKWIDDFAVAFSHNRRAYCRTFLGPDFSD